MTVVKSLLPRNKKFVTKDNIKLIQPNKVTNAQYSFTELEENILIHIISSLQDFMTKDYPLQCDLFGQPIIRIDISKTKYHQVEKRLYLRACKKFIKKTISFDWRNKENKAIGTTATFITAYHNIKGTPYIELTLNEWAIPYLIYWGKGHTKFIKSIALTLKGSHTKRLYTLLKQWQNNRGAYGEYTTTIDAFRKQFGLTKKYPLNADLERFVIKPAKDRLKKQADIYFNYKMSKSNGSRGYTHITFLIHKNNKNVTIEEKTDMFKLVYHVIGWAFPPSKNSKALDITNEIAQEPDNLFKAYRRFNKEYQSYQAGEKELKDIIPLVKFILKEDYGQA